MQTVLVDDINNPTPENTALQPGRRVIKLDLNIKILYSLFNFFSPVGVGTLLFASALEEEQQGAGYTVFVFCLLVLSVLVGGICLLVKWVKYNRFLAIENNCIYLCKGKENAPRILDTLPLAEVEKNLGTTPTAIYKNTKKKLLYPSFSWVGKICWLGPLLILFIGHERMIARRKMAQLHAVLPQLFAKEPKDPGHTEYVLMQIVTWGLVGLMSLLGLFGLLQVSYVLFSVALAG